MPALRTRNTVVLAKIEGTEGVDAAPVAGTDAVLVESPRINVKPVVITTNEVTSSLDDFGAIVGGMTVEISFDCYLKGSAAAGTAPEWGKLLKACRFAETITATAVPAAPEACAAGGSTTTAVRSACRPTSAHCSKRSADRRELHGHPLDAVDEVRLQHVRRRRDADVG